MNCSDARMRSTNDATSPGCPTNAARTTSAITGWSASRSGRMTTPSATGGDGTWGTPFAPPAKQLLSVNSYNTLSERQRHIILTGYLSNPPDPLRDLLG